MANELYLTFNRKEGQHYRPLARMTGMPYLKEGGAVMTADDTVLVFDRTVRGAVRRKNVSSGVVVVTPGTPARTRNPANITWEAPGTVVLSELQSGKYGAVSDGAGGFIITGRNFRSDVPGTPAFKVGGNVQVLVTFKECNFFGYGVQSTSGRGIVYGEFHNAVRFEQSIWFSGKPPAGYASAFAGKMVNLDTPSHFSFVGCEQYKCGGIWVRKFWAQSSSGRTDQYAFYVGQSAFYDIDSRMVDSAGNWRTGSTANTDFDPAGIITFQNALAVPGGLLEDFIVSNDPLYGAQGEDIISYYRSSPAVGKNIVARRFLLEGLYVYDQTFTGTQAVHGSPTGSRKFFSGTSGNMGDGLEALNDDGSSAAARSRDTVPNNLIMQDGTLIGWSNMGLSISTGNRNGFLRVKAINPGAFRSSNARGYTTITGPTYALQVWDQSNNYAGTNPYSPGSGSTALWGSHFDTDCIFGCWTVNATTGALTTSSSAGGNMVYIPGANDLAGLTTTNRTLLATPADALAAITLGESYRAAQMAVWSSAGTIIGCTAPAA